MQVISAPRILRDGRLDAPGWLSIDAGAIVDCGAGTPPAPADVTLGSGVLAPGLIDLQINGAFGHDFAQAEPDDWRTVGARLLATGVTAYVPTIITAPVAQLAASLTRYRRLRGAVDDGRGARTLGMHCEGPFLAPNRRGAHREDLLIDPAPEVVDTLVDAAGRDLASVTLAPERPGGIAAIERLVARGVRVSVGHSDATDRQVAEAVEAGATMVTHLFNAQRPLHHRDPGVVGAALADPRLTVGLIADLHHVAPTAVQVAFAAAAGRLALVTDAIAALGMAPGTYELGGLRVTVRAEEPPVLEDGTLAGSVLRLDQAVGNVVRVGVDPALALSAATRVPADALGRGDLGRLAPGARADLVWLDDDWRTVATWVDGQLRHLDDDGASRAGAVGLTPVDVP